MPPQSDEITENVTAVTSHPGWKAVAQIVGGLEASIIESLRLTVNAGANQRLVILTSLKAEIQKWSEKEDIWNA